jgi:ribonuclease BN (tRNA processing enzyme)
VSRVEIGFLGTGDAVGSGGRLQTCILVTTENGRFLLDCGTTSLVAMKRRAIDPATVDAIVLSHLHGDHFGGIPFLVLDAQFGGRDRPLLIAGPPGTRSRIETAMEVLFPGSTRVRRRFDLNVTEMSLGVTTPIGPASIVPFSADHASGAPSFIVRALIGDKVIVYSGDTAWTESLVDAARNADLLICEAYFFEKKVKYHLDYETLLRHRDRLRCGRIILTHMSDDMLGRLDDVQIQCADDGLTVVL